MIRRTVLIAAAGAALAIVPTAAFGYGASDYSNKGTVSDSTPSIGQGFTVIVHGPAGVGVSSGGRGGAAMAADIAPLACFFFAFFPVLAGGGAAPFAVGGRIAACQRRQVRMSQWGPRNRRMPGCNLTT